MDTALAICVEERMPIPPSENSTPASRNTVSIPADSRINAPAPAALLDAQPPSSGAVGTNGQSDFIAQKATTFQAKLNEVRALMLGNHGADQESHLIDVLRGISAGELNQIISALPRDEVRGLIENMKNHVLGPDNSEAVLKFFSQERVGDLNVDSKVKLIQAMQYGGANDSMQFAIGRLFTSTQSASLTALKNALDQSGDFRDLQQLVFRDIGSSWVRQQILEHFAAAAPAKDERVKVLSDIDDTFYVNYKDTRYPKQTVYPGVRALYAELDRGAGVKPDAEGDLMFLSARPADPLGAIEGHSRTMLHEHQVTQATVLSGDLAHLTSDEMIASKKYQNWEQVRQLYPEYGTVFIGDSGQGDAIFGAHAAGFQPGDMRAVFIHNVTDLDASARAEFASQNVFIFDTYVGAATEAYKKKLISADGLQRVMASATRELSAVSFASSEQRAKRQEELDRDLAAARAVLPARS